MQATPDPVAVLLAELIRRGIELRRAPGGRLRYRPRSTMTPELAERLAARKGDLLRVLISRDPMDDWKPQERRLLAGCPPGMVELAETTKAAYASIGCVDVSDARPFKGEARDDAARLIREARARSDGEAAATTRDAWRERLAICTVDGELSIRRAEVIARDAAWSNLSL